MLPLTEKNKHVIAASLGWDSRYSVSADEIKSVEQVGGTLWVNLVGGRVAPLSTSVEKLLKQSLP